MPAVAQVERSPLSVTGTDGPDDLSVTCVEGAVFVGGAPVDPARSCDSVSRVVVQAGGGADTVDLTGLVAPGFALDAGLSTETDLGPGADQFLGSPGGDLVTSGTGSDTMAGGINLSGCMQSKGYAYVESGAPSPSAGSRPDSR